MRVHKQTSQGDGGHAVSVGLHGADAVLLEEGGNLRVHIEGEAVFHRGKIMVLARHVPKAAEKQQRDAE